MKHEGTVSLFQYWDRLRGEREAPNRTDIEPADIKSILADTFILEQNEQGEAIYRLAGTRLCAAFGRELKGTVFAQFWADKDRRVLERLVQGAFRLNNVVVVSFLGVSQGGRTNQFELLVLPLDGGQANLRALGAISPLEKPFWLGADPIAQCRIESLRIIDPTVDSLFLNNRPEVKVPPLVPDDELAGDQGRCVGHLLVLEGGREK